MGAVVVLAAVLFISADAVVSRLAKREMNQVLSGGVLPGIEGEVGEVYINILSGSAVIRDLSFSTNRLATIDIPTLAVWSISYRELLRNRRLVVHKISLDTPKAQVSMDTDHPERLLPEGLQQMDFSSGMPSISIKHFEIENLSGSLLCTNAPVQLSIDSLSCEFADIGFRDSVFCFNDSVYSLSLAAGQIETQDIRCELSDISYQPSGSGLQMGYTRVRNLISPAKMAEKAQEPVTWIDMELNSLTTAPCNLIRKIQAQDWTLDKTDVDVRRMHICRDQRYKPKQPFGTPQEFLRSLPVLFRVKEVNALAHKIDIELYTTAKNCGKMHLRNGRGQIRNVSNIPGTTWLCRAKAPFGEKGQVEARYDFRMDKVSSFEIEIKGKDIELGDMNPFIRPLVGITTSCTADRIEALYQGDQTTAQGTFSLLYHGLDVQVHKEDDVPYKVVTQNADLFTALANSLVPKSNPTAVDIHPRRYKVAWKRDIWQPYPLYLFGPCIDGVKMTMLPGLYVHKQVN